MNSGNSLNQYNPSGRIRVFDDELARNGINGGLMPLQGVKVRARRWFASHEALTDANGLFRINERFHRAVNYSIIWERNDFDIRDGVFVQAYYNGPKQKSAWNLDIVSGESLDYATIHRAANDYYYNPILGLKRPPQNSFWKTRVKIAARQNWNENGDHCKDCRILGLFPSIRIGNLNRPTPFIYGTTIHELAHASHWDMKATKWTDILNIVQESWAEGVELELTLLEYQTLGLPNYDYISDRYQLKRLPMGNYTSVVRDLIDNENQRITRNNINLPVDRVEAYTILQIENAIRGQKDMPSWRNRMRDLYNNPTEQFLEELFNNF